MMKKKRLMSIIPVLVFVIGLSLLLYPTVSNKWNQRFQRHAVQEYDAAVESLTESEYKRLLEEARTYNQVLYESQRHFALIEEEEQLYNSMLQVKDTGVMAQIEIPRLDVTMAIFHGTDEEVLESGIGHLEWSSLPVGGENTHCVISGHRGLPSARLFTDLDEMEQGDLFYINVLNERLTYKVDQILTVEPDDVSALQIIGGQDLCTLVTCTPYGVNTHRLLVRGHKVDNPKEEVLYISGDAMQIDPLFVAPCLMIPIVILVILVLRKRQALDEKMFHRRKKKTVWDCYEKQNDEDRKV